MSGIKTTVLLGMVIMSTIEVIKRHFYLAYGAESHCICYVLLVVASFVALHVAFNPEV